MVEPYKHLYTIKEAAFLLHTNASTVYSYINTGKLIALRLGSLKIRGRDLEEFINKWPNAVVFDGEMMEERRQTECL